MSEEIDNEGPLNDRRAQKRKKQREARAIAKRREDTAFVMSDERGRRFMYELIFYRLGLQDVYQSNDAGIHRHEGRRDAAVKLGLELQADHADAYILMIMERMEYVKATRATEEVASDTGDSE